MRTPTDFYKINLACLKTHQPEAWAAVTSIAAETMGDIITHPGERPNLAVTTKNGDKILLHDTTDEHFALQIVPADAHGVAVLFGMGLGYGALALRTQRPNIRHLVIFELYPGILIQALQCQDLTPLISDPRLILSIGAKPDFSHILAPAALTMKLEFSYILEHRSSFSIDPVAYQELRDNAYEFINACNINGNTLRRFGESFLHNTFCHFKSIHHNLLLENIHGMFKDIPAILVAGGPSLNKNIDQLAKAKGNALIISVDTALPALLAHGITPDIVGAMDAQELAYEKIADLASQAK
ncbi:MAG: DUF115 domain-containing protein, partial [Desulfobulbaceae bacterium]|nr:DUF115 domain-containing protein [Desulfobulbaceae bacterium]